MPNRKAAEENLKETSFRFNPATLQLIDALVNGREFRDRSDVVRHLVGLFTANYVPIPGKSLPDKIVATLEKMAEKVKRAKKWPP